MEDEELREKLCKGVTPPESSDFRKVEKVLAPFMQTLKKRKHDKADVLPAVYEELYLKRTPKELLTFLQAGFSDPLELRTLMNETAELLKVVTKSKSFNLYLADYDRGEIVLCPKYYQSNRRFERRYPIGTDQCLDYFLKDLGSGEGQLRSFHLEFCVILAFQKTERGLLFIFISSLCAHEPSESGTYLAAHVAFTKEYVISGDILGDVRFPQGIPDVPVVKSVICLPIITNVEENCIGIIELYRECSDKPYDLVNLQICNALTSWMGIAVEQNKARLNLMKDFEIQTQFSNLADLYFSGAFPFNRVVSDFLKLTKAAVNADRGAFYIFHDAVSLQSEETLTADAYEEGIDDLDDMVLYKKKVSSRFVKDQPGIPGYVARTGEIINIYDAYKDFRFDRKTDPPFYRTRSVVAFPIKNENGVIGVLLLMNNLDYPYFRTEDISLVQSFLNFVTLICGYFLLDRAYSKAQLKLLVSERLLDFHTKPSAEDLNLVKTFTQGDQQPSASFFDFQWYISWNEDESLKYISYIFMLSDILELSFEVQNLWNFIFKIKKSYRVGFYHNFEHAFYVLHFAFLIVWKNKGIYSAAETVTILLAALCHDVDHPGLTNTFLGLINDPTYKLYGDMCGEAHRFELIMFFIQQTDLLSNVSAATFQTISKSLKRLILGFNLGIVFQNRQTITALLNANSFSWENPEHRILSQNMILLCSDHSVHFKNFEVSKKFSSSFYKELYKQGDLEKSLGFSPLPMLDRKKIDASPQNQVILLSIVVSPAVEILVRLFPNLDVLDKLLRDTIDQWNELLKSQGQEMWKMNQALVKTEKKTAHKMKLSSTISSIRTTVSKPEVRNTE